MAPTGGGQRKTGVLLENRKITQDLLVYEAKALRIWRKCAWPNTITWPSHSRRMDRLGSPTQLPGSPDLKDTLASLKRRRPSKTRRHLPDYLRRLEVVTRMLPNQVDLTPEKRWAS